MPSKPQNRRDFIKKAGILTAGLATMQLPSWAWQANAKGYPLHNIPADKNIDPAWIRSLYQRGKTSSYRKSKNELKYIGMPVGGLHTGTVYAGGDGRLWLWQIYNESFEGLSEGIDPKVVNWDDGTSVRKIPSRDGAAYIEPSIAANKRLLEQGFAVKMVHNGKTFIKELKEEHWDEIIFSPSYPIATVTYVSKDFPAAVSLKIYSPFIPLDADNSALPATILRLTVKNPTKDKISVSVLGWMENGVSKLSAKENTGSRINTASRTTDSTSVVCSFDTESEELRTAGDYGSMCFTQHGDDATASALLDAWPITNANFAGPDIEKAVLNAPDKLVGAIRSEKQIAPGKSVGFDFSISWHFNNPHPKLKKIVKDAEAGYYYGARFKDAAAVSQYINANFEKLATETELWGDTWKDSTLPHWFLERTFLNIGTLATANTYRFADKRFWSWEGVGMCPGTCTHVWQYAHAVARIFPELERGLRQNVDLGVGFKEDTGAIIFRAENERRPAIDGQAGTILRFYREHQMSTDDIFLRTNWPKIKKAVQFMLEQDRNGDGMTDKPMENTLDAVWEGEIAWIVGLCIAAASAAQAMAVEMKDPEFAGICGDYVRKGSKNMEADLFNGEYFIHRPDPVQGRKKLGSYNTCHIDQVYGQSWAFQVGLPRILSKEKTVAALRSLWRYNFTTDVGPYIKTHLGGRPYALAGDGGMIMNTNPHNEPKPYGENETWQLGYFHECMSGFEHQVAAHLMAEGMTDESLILTRAIHDRYDAAKRNPFNEIECSDHYARAMASYGTFIAACGFEYHGPKGYIRFAPILNPNNFKTPFTTATGWGTYTQKRSGPKQIHSFDIRYGELQLREINLEKLVDKLNSVSVTLASVPIAVKFKQDGNSLHISIDKKVIIKKGQVLNIIFT